jgi:hypothetical protein
LPCPCCPRCYDETAGGFIWSGGSLSGRAGGPLFAVGNTDNETTILQQPQP